MSHGDFRFATIVQAFLTITLLGFSFLMRDFAPELASMVVGAALTHWFKESAHLGRAANTTAQPVTVEGEVTTREGGRHMGSQLPLSLLSLLMVSLGILEVTGGL